MPVALVPVVMVAMNMVYALSSYPAGALSDRIGRNGLVAMGIGILIVADLFLGAARSILLVMVGVALWGLHMGLTQGLLATLVADTAPVELRGTAFGVLNFCGGVAMLAASLIAGGLWDAFGAGATFLAGAAISTVALVGFLYIGKKETSAGGTNGQ
jgi:MFS family permease